MNKSHGMTSHPLYRTWVTMRNRCYNQNNQAYKRYGSRGIKVCDRWQWFPNFVEDVGKRPKGHTLDRKDNDGNYSPENCQWATPLQQQQNKTKKPGEYVYKTKYNTYTVSKRIDGTNKSFGTYKTKEEALAVAKTLYD